MKTSTNCNSANFWIFFIHSNLLQSDVPSQHCTLDLLATFKKFKATEPSTHEFKIIATVRTEAAATAPMAKRAMRATWSWSWSRRRLVTAKYLGPASHYTRSESNIGMQLNHLTSMYSRAKQCIEILIKFFTRISQRTPWSSFQRMEQAYEYS